MTPQDDFDPTITDMEPAEVKPKDVEPLAPPPPPIVPTPHRRGSFINATYSGLRGY